MPQQPRLRSAVRDGVAIRYRDLGAGSPPLLFLHGWGCDHRFFAPQLDAFSARHRVVAPDQRGFGQSDQPAQVYTVEGFADDAAWLCRELSLSRPVIVGHSLGGAIALAVAARQPDLCAGIVLCDPAVFLPEAAHVAQRALLAGLEGPAWLDALRGFVELHLFLESDDPDRKAWIVEQMCAAPRPVLASAFRELIGFDCETAARACRVPVLAILAGAPVVDEARFRACCPQLETAYTPEAGHFHQLEAPERINALLRAFLDAHALRGSEASC